MTYRPDDFGPDFDPFAPGSLSFTLDRGGEIVGPKYARSRIVQRLRFTGAPLDARRTLVDAWTAAGGMRRANLCCVSAVVRSAVDDLLSAAVLWDHPRWGLDGTDPFFPLPEMENND